MDQLIDPLMQISGSKLNPAEQVPIKIPETDYVVSALLTLALLLTIAPLFSPRFVRSASWFLGIGASVVCYVQADKRDKQRAYSEAARDASFDVLAIRLARSVERESQN